MLDDHYKILGKRRITVKGDGHCLPRAVFSSLKRKNLLPDISSYKELLQQAVNEVKKQDYAIWLNDGKEKADAELKAYEEMKVYTTNIVDVVIAALAKITLTKLKIVLLMVKLSTTTNFYQKTEPSYRMLTCHSTMDIMTISYLKKPLV